MPNVLVAIGNQMEVDGKDLLDFLDRVKLTGEAAASPRAMMALAVLALPVGYAVADAMAAASQGGLNIVLDVTTAELIINCWPDLQAYLKTLAIQPAKGENIMRLLKTAALALLCSLLIWGPVGCTPATQAKVNTYVQDIANWTPVVSSDASALLTDIASFEPADALQIHKLVAAMQTDSAALTELCKQYLAAPSSSLLTQIASTVSTLATGDSAALLQVLQIKDPTSQMIAQGILTTIATALTILSGYLAAAGTTVTPAASAALERMRPFVNRKTLDRELDWAKAQGLAPRFATLNGF